MISAIRKCMLPLGSVLALFAAGQLAAQERYTRFEFGAEYSTIRQIKPGGTGVNHSGFGGRFDWNLNRRLAFESQIDFFPEQSLPLFLRQGGRTTQAVFGVRAKVIQTRRIAVFGLLRPGLLHFTDVLDVTSFPSLAFRSKTANYFQLNLGGGIEYNLTPRWVARFDITGNPYRVTNSYLNGSIFAPGKIEDATRMSFGVAYRTGAFHANEAESFVPGKLELGPLFSTLVIAREGSSDGVRREPGFGGYASYRFYRVLYLDGDLLYFPRSTASSGPHDGGEILQGLFGLKGGIRRNRLGLFGKARPGFHSYSQTLATTSFSPQGAAINTYNRSTSFVLDLGGIIEIYPNERGTLRLEAGDTHIFFSPKTVIVGGFPVSFSGGRLRHSIQFIAGYGWRF